MVSGGGGSVGLLLGVDSGALVGDISDVSVISVGGVLHVLDSAIGKSDGVSTLDVAGTIGSLLSVEVSLGVVVGDGVGEGVGRDLIGVGLGLVDGVSNDGSVVDHGGVDGVGNDGSSVDSVSHNWGGVDSVVGHRGSVDQRGCEYNCKYCCEWLQERWRCGRYII